MCFKWSSIKTEGLNCDGDDCVRASPEPQVFLGVCDLQGFVHFYKDNQI